MLGSLGSCWDWLTGSHRRSSPLPVGVIAWTVWKKPSCLRKAWAAALLAVVGALPWIVWNIGHGWVSFTVRAGGSSAYAHRFRLFFSPIMPMMAGFRAPFTQERLLPALLTYAIYAALSGLFVLGAYRSRNKNSSLLYVVAAVFPLVYAFGAQTLISNDPRYVIVLTPVLALLLGQMMTTLPRAAILLALACALTVVTLHHMEPSPGSRQGSAPRDLTPLISTLDRLHLSRIYATYWIAYLLDFDTGERIIAVENKFDQVTFTNGKANLPNDPYVKYPPYERAVAAAPHGFVFFRDSIGSIPIIAKLIQHGYTPSLVGRFVVYAKP